MKIFYKILIIFILTAHPVYAEIKADGGLNWLIHSALKNNPDLQSILNQSNAAKELIKYSSTLEDPILSAGIVNFPLADMSFNASNMTMKRIALAQKFPGRGKLKLKGKVSKYSAEAIVQQYNEKQMEVVNNIKQAYFDLFYAVRAIETIEKNKKLILNFINITQANYEVGKGSFQDILKAQIEFSKLDREIIELEKQREILKKRLLNLAYLPYDTILQNPEKTTFSRVHFKENCSAPELIKYSYEYRPLLNELKNKLISKENELKFAKKDTKPDYNVFGAYGQRQQRSDLYSLNFALNLPVRKKNRQHRKIAQAEYEIKALNAQISATKNDIQYNIEKLLVETEKDLEIIELLSKTLMPQSKQVLDSTLANYEVGKTDFLSLIDAQLMYYNYEVEYFRKIADYCKNLANLEQEVGRTLF